VIFLPPFALHPAMVAPDSFLASRPLFISNQVVLYLVVVSFFFVADMFRVSLVVLVPIETPSCVAQRGGVVVQPTDW
jgi:hypothetical protein